MTFESLEPRRMLVRVTELTLVDAETGQDIGPLADGATVNLARFAADTLSIRAKGSRGTESVRFRLNGKSHIENGSSYWLAGLSKDGRPSGWRATEGSHSLAVTAYSRDGARGSTGRTLIRFEVINDVAGVPQPMLRSPSDDAPSRRRLTFADEFDDNSLGEWKTNIWWSPDGEPGRNVGEERTSPSNVSVADGSLRITATANRNRYRSGVVTSEGLHEFQYGYVESRIRLPAGVGFWPAFWMLPADHRDDAGEIDIVEWVGNAPNDLNVNYHSDGHDDVPKSDDVGVDLSENFHTFGVDWQSDKITWYLDGEAFHEAPNYTHTPMYLILNLAVGGEWPGKPNADTKFPSVMEIDYVRVWDDAA